MADKHFKVTLLAHMTYNESIYDLCKRLYFLWRHHGHKDANLKWFAKHDICVIKTRLLLETIREVRNLLVLGHPDKARAVDHRILISTVTEF